MDLESEMRERMGKANPESHALWRDLVRAEEAAGRVSLPFQAWAERERRNLHDGQGDPSRVFDRAVGREIDRICQCSGCQALTREECAQQIQFAQAISQKVGYNAGWAKASVRWTREKYALERAIRWLRLALAVCVFGFCGTVLIWVLCK